MPPPPVGVALLGYGYWGVNVARALRAAAGVDLRAVADPAPDRRRAIERAGYPAAAGLDEVLERADVEAVVVATPARTHAEVALRSIEAGRAVLVEKPLATSSAEAARLVEAARRAGRTLMVGHTFLYHAAVRRLRRYLDEGDLGRVLYAYAQRLNLGRVRDDVDALWNFAPHDVSILLYLLGESPAEVACQAFSPLGRPVADVAFLALRFPSGIAAHVHVSWLDPNKVRRLTLVGERKMAVYDDVSTDAKITVFDKGFDRSDGNPFTKEVGSFAEFQLIQRAGGAWIEPVALREPLVVQAEHFASCVRSGEAPMTDGVHGAAVVRVLEAADASRARGGAVVAVPAP